MKKILIAIILITILFAATGCATKIVDKTGTVRQLLYGRFVVLEEVKDTSSGNSYLCYEKTTKIMYYLTSSPYKGGISPCWIFDDDTHTAHVAHWPEDWNGD